MNLDIHSTVVTALLLALVGIFFTFLTGVNSIRSGSSLPFFRKKRDRIVRGWRFIFSAGILGLVAFFLYQYAEPSIYHFFPPTPTITLTPTVTLTPTISQTPTLTITPTITNTPSITDTPSLPQAVQAGFQTTIVPNPDAVFSPMQFAKSVDKVNQPVNPSKEFKNPVSHLYGTFSFDKMKDGSQWSALWYRGADLVYFETSLWKGGTGGFGYTDWAPDSDAWLPGVYEVQIFVGTDWKLSGRFTVTGNPPPPTPTLSPTPEPSQTFTASATPSKTATRTLRPTFTQTGTPTITRTYRPTETSTPTRTTWPTPAKAPTLTPSPTASGG
jgi:hypothetical protein